VKARAEFGRNPLEFDRYPKKIPVQRVAFAIVKGGSPQEIVELVGAQCLPAQHDLNPAVFAGRDSRVLALVP
jgi:hypothetical protein